ncbi:MAG: tRNA uridine-5-carboxymethylaminomethyl(34) synthesis GTPase MnmE [Chlamydiae bacterium]|jgi:tRNA modification GTPase|nr:tRNA uridine-5-carboxymethylaminomethyl(34) synthesis GTPase MnmE [Chlamydiota bacterium]
MYDETIAAIATPPGEGAISIVRISGKKSFDIASAIFSGHVETYASHTAHFGKIFSKDGAVIDEVLLLVMHEGKSYTGEASVEINCHGGSFITQKVLARVLEAGARAARPGEFSLRAFKNNRIDLAQAEAVQELIHAKNELALKAASDQLQGRLSILVKEMQLSITDITAIIEAWVDYPEEGLEFATNEEILDMLHETKKKLENLSKTFHDGATLNRGSTLCLIGAPNVGKSSLMNALLDQERAIVTDIPGTTRDLLHEDLFIEGMPFRLLDTAGIRKTHEIIEKEGIERSKKAARGADLVLILLDISRPLTEEEKLLLETYPNALIIWNKVDLSYETPLFPGIKISAKSRKGLSELKKEIVNRIWKNRLPDKELIILTKERHFLAVNEAINCIDAVILGFHQNISPEFLAFDLRLALKALAEIIGTNVTEDILGAIFAKFCVGK